MHHPGFEKYKGRASKTEDYKEIREKSRLNVCFLAPSANALVSSGLEIWLPTPTRLQTGSAHLDGVFKKWIPQDLRPTASEQENHRAIRV